MIKVYDNVLDENLMQSVRDYFLLMSKYETWSSNLCWQEGLASKSPNIATHTIRNKNLCNKIKNSIENKLNVDFDEKNLNFFAMIFVWYPCSYISWHNDDEYPYNGTIYLNEKWNSNDGGIFLYEDNKTKSIIGIEPKYNLMVTNSSIDSDLHSSHCVTCIPPNVSERRITIQWVTKVKSKDKDKDKNKTPKISYK